MMTGEQEGQLPRVPRMPDDARRYCAKCGEIFMANRFACPYCGATRRDPPLLDARSLTAVLTDLPRARDEANLDERSFLALRQTYERWLLAARPARQSAVAPRPAPAPAHHTEPVERPRTPIPSAPARPAIAPRPAEAAPVPPAAPAPRQPSAWGAWFRQWRQRLAAEVALHGLLYFGVLLTFIGSLGFALFAFGSVNVSLRPVAELLTPGLLFCAAWFLRRHGLRLAAGSLELLAGALELVALFTSFNDGAPIPPDLSGAALAAGWAASALMLLVVYALVVHRRPSSALRFLVAPLFWVALWSLGMAAGSGRFSVWQYPLAAAGIAITLAVADRYPEHELARATQRAGMLGLPLSYGLVMLFALREGWPALPLALTGLAVLTGSELLDRSLRTSRQFPLLQMLLVAATLLTLTPDWGPGRVGLLATVVSIGLLEWRARGRSGVASDYLALIIGGAGLLGTFPQSPLAVVAWGTASLWLHSRTCWFRRLLPGGEVWQPLLCAALPAVFGYQLWLSLPHEPAWLLMSTILLAIALLVRWRPAPERTRFYGWSLPPAAGAILAVTATVAQSAGLPASIALPLTAALLAVIVGVSARWPQLRLWGAAIAGAWAVQLTLNALAAGPDLRALAWAAIGLGLALAAWQWRARPLSAHLLVAGYLLGGLGPCLAGAGANRSAVLSLWLLTGLVAVVAHETGRVSLGWLAPRRAWFARILACAPLVALLTSIPFWIIALGDLASLFAQRGHTGVALSLTGLCYGLAGRRLSMRRPLAPIVAVAAVTLAVVGISVAAPVLVPSTIAVALAIAIVAVLGGSLRRPYMSWLAWTLSGLLLLLLAHLAGVAAGNLPRALFGWSCVCLLGGLAYDDLRAGRSGAGEGLRHDWLLKPVALGAIALPASLAFSFSQPASVFGWWALAAAAVYMAVAWQLRAGSVSFAGWALASLAVTVLLPRSAWQEPALWLPQAALLLLVAYILDLRNGGARWWLRWDVAPLLTAHVVALVALTRSTSAGSMAITWAGFGVLSLALAGWKRQWPWAAAGAPLILIGSNQAGPGWFALSLGLAATASMLLAGRTRNLLRPAAQWASAAFAAWAWWEMLLWTGWSQGRQVNASLLAVAAVALSIALLVRTGRAAPSWLACWGTLALAALAACVFILSDHRPPWTLAMALLVFGLASVILAPVSTARLRVLVQCASAGFMGWAWWEFLLWSGWNESRQIDASLLALAAVALSFAALVRMRRIAPSWLIGWSAVELAGLGACVLAVSGQRPPWTLAAALLAVGLACLTLAPVATGWLRIVAQSASAGFAGWAWVEMLLWTGWSQSRQVDASLLALAAVALGVAALVRFGRAAPSWLIGWSVLALSGLGACLLLVAGRRPPWALTLALLAFALASATLAPVSQLRRLRLRELSLVFIFLAGEAAAASAGLTPLPHLTWALLAGLIALVLLAAGRRTAVLQSWLAALLLYAGLQSLMALVLAALLWPDRTGLIGTIGIFGVEAAVLGLLLRRTGVLALSPPLLCAAWLLFATRGSGGGDVQWITVPIGVAILAVVEIARLPRELGAEDAASPISPPLSKEMLLLLEYIGIAFVCGAALVEALTIGVVYAFAASLWGLSICGWAVLTRVRRRLQAGAGVASLGLILVVAVPVAQLVPHITGVGLWATLAGMGALFLVVATTLEQSRARVGAALHRLGELTEVWE